jgi:sarcosine oxidase subunit alpha
LLRPGNRDGDRKQLVGLEPLEPMHAVRPGAHLLLGDGRKAPAPSGGWITSAAYSPTLSRYVALGVLSAGRARLGETVTVIDEEGSYEMRVVPPVFYDPDNEKLQN